MKKKFQFSIIPVAGSAAGGGTAIATAFNAAFYTGNESTTSLSTVTFAPWFTFDGKFVLPFKNLVWLPNDVLLSKGDTRFMIYPQYTWGIGGNTNTDNKVLLEYNYLRFYHSFLKKAGKIIYLVRDMISTIISTQAWKKIRWPWPLFLYLIMEKNLERVVLHQAR